MKTAINFLTQTPTFTKTQCAYALPGGAHCFAVPGEGGDPSSEGKERNPPSGFSDTLNALVPHVSPSPEDTDLVWQG